MVAKDNADHSGVDIFIADAQGNAEGPACMSIYADGVPKLSSPPPWLQHAAHSHKLLDHMPKWRLLHQ